MRFRGVKRDRCDVFVIGGGGAGLRAAVAAREAGADTVLVSKARVGYSNNTFISKATIAATGFGLPDDDAHVHEKDTFESGRLLLYEGLVFEGGAILRNAQGEDILLKHGLKDPKLATRDRVSQVLTQEILEGRGVGGGVVMDLGKLAEAMPASLRMQLPANWTPSLRHLTVSPTTHFCMGGVIAGPDAATSLPGLFAAGEVCGGVHGANRLGGNALAEVFVMGAEAGASAAGLAKNIETAPPSELEIHAEKARLEDLGVPEGREAHECAQRLKQVMWQHGSIVRSGEGLQQALSAIEKLGSEEAGITVKSPRDLRAALEFRNMRLVSEMVCRAALMRTESRGAHFRVDFPEEDGRNWVKCIVLTKGEGGVRLAPAASGAAAKPRDIIRSS
jgi:fumarate reductase (CoM/CoB) subunit A